MLSIIRADLLIKNNFLVKQGHTKIYQPMQVYKA